MLNKSGNEIKIYVLVYSDWNFLSFGEEQYLQGMLDWDEVPNRKYNFGWRAMKKQNR